MECLVNVVGQCIKALEASGEEDPDVIEAIHYLKAARLRIRD